MSVGWLRQGIRRMFPAEVPAPAHLRARFRSLSSEARSRLDAALDAHRGAAPPPGPDAARERRRDREDHRFRRLELDRRRVIPWLDAARPLHAARVLEVGCGTGSSTVALAEQGAQVTAIDLDASAVRVARERCSLYRLDAVEFAVGNATEVMEKLRGERFDFVIYFAALEHMTHDERLRAMRTGWELLAPGDLWCVVETPNRLWPFDAHTALLPFFHWLPDRLAFEYSRYSPRPGFGDRYREPNPDAELEFLRRGRGVSFHEFELSFGPAERLDVVSSLNGFRASRLSLRRWRRARSFEGRWAALLAGLRPDLHPGFFERDLDLVIRKR